MSLGCVQVLQGSKAEEILPPVPSYVWSSAQSGSSRRAGSAMASAACLPADTAAAPQGGVQASPLCCRSCAGCSLSARRIDTFRVWRRGFHFLPALRGWTHVSCVSQHGTCSAKLCEPPHVSACYVCWQYIHTHSWVQNNTSW